MPHFFLILLKINLVLVLFAATYYLVLRRLTFYSINRMFLMFGILFSTAYPLINLSNFLKSGDTIPAFVPQLNQNVSQLVQQNSISMLWQALTILFYLGVLVMGLRLMVQFISLSRMHKTSLPGILKHNKVRILRDKVSPFSFWQTIYINPNLHKEQDLEHILEHEKTHIEEWHTLDVVLAEICVVFYWFNPGVWLMKKAVRENIEFITDAKILAKGVDKKSYQYSLLDVGTLRPATVIVNNFNLSDLKKRIQMMNAKRSSKVNLTWYLLALPVLLCITLAFTIDKKDDQRERTTFKNTVKSVLPQKKPVVITPSKDFVKTKAIKKVNGRHITLPDTAGESSLISGSVAKEADSVHRQFDIILKSLSGKVKVSSINTKRSLDGRQTDTIMPDRKQITVVISRAEHANSEPVKGASIQSTSGRITANTAIAYYLNGTKISREEMNRLDASAISSLKVDKNARAVQITTKP